MGMLAQTFNPSAQQWAILGLMAIVGGAILVARWKMRPLDGSPKQYRREIDSANRETGQIRDDMERLLGELETLSTRMNAQLDEKHARIQDAIRDADQRIFALRTLVQASREPEPAARSGLEAPTPEEARLARIHELSDKGMTTLEIARQVEQPVGEVELILNLRRASGLVSKK